VARTLDIIDEIDSGGHDVRLAFHFGPDVSVAPDGTGAVLRWPGAVTPGAARLALPAGLAWSLHRGETNPILGWYSSGLERRVPAYTLLGCGRSAAGEPFRTRLEFVDADMLEESAFTRPAVSWGTSDAPVRKMPGIQAEAG
jgi:hypothetical protein